ncbi:MAG: trehalose-phosphatase [Hyphomicrobiaceae bacterium]
MPSGFNALNQLSVSSTALFLDFDGTLAGLVDRPENVRIEARTLANLVRAFKKLDGALAIITGRDLTTLDAFLAPHVFPASGVHGFETRDSDGLISRRSANLEALDRVRHLLAEFAGEHHDLLLETKPASIALHYRRRPELADRCQQAVREALSGESELRVMQGKMVVEIKAHQGDKGQAILAFLDQPPFGERVPVFIGDDVTDEAAFAAVNARGGVSIKVGAGDTCATYRLQDPNAVHDWLGALAGDGNHQGQLEDVAT